MYLYFDTETSGLPTSGPLTSQPHVVQLAALLLDDRFKEVSAFSVIIKPDAWEVQQGAAAVHGIDTVYAHRVGIDIRSALSMFAQLTKVAEILVAHNLDFDRKILGYEFERLGKPGFLSTCIGECTMLMSTPVCKIPSNRGGYKWPKLQEAFSYFEGREFEGAHDAMADVRACATVHRKLLALRNPTIPV